MEKNSDWLYIPDVCVCGGEGGAIKTRGLGGNVFAPTIGGQSKYSDFNICIEMQI